MPDVLAHFLFGIALTLVLRVESREEGMLVILGSVIIDVERPFSLLVMALDLDVLGLHNSFHSLLGAFCVAITASWCFESFENSKNLYWKRFGLIFSGCVVHLLADMTMQPWEELGVYLLYPLKIPFSFNLFWSGFIGYPLIGLIACTGALGWFVLSKLYESSARNL
ncbi:MAG: metal-dependent hydrolase [Candidatus Hodarchaeales archaeon]|jgi:membrane-bound metal-dependent hydrolase YbcI (DUF457 family)